MSNASATISREKSRDSLDHSKKVLRKFVILTLGPCHVFLRSEWPKPDCNHLSLSH